MYQQSKLFEDGKTFTFTGIEKQKIYIDFLKEKFANIALNLSEVDTNPIKYS